MDFNEQYKELEKAALDEIINPNVPMKFMNEKNYANSQLEIDNRRHSYISSITGNRIFLPKVMF